LARAKLAIRPFGKGSIHPGRGKKIGRWRRKVVKGHLYYPFGDKRLKIATT